MKMTVEKFHFSKPFCRNSDGSGFCMHKILIWFLAKIQFDYYAMYIRYKLCVVHYAANKNHLTQWHTISCVPNIKNVALHLKGK